MVITRLRQTNRSIALVSAAAILVALALASLIFRTQASLFELPLTEDGYYLLSVSRNIALGNGLTIDGRQLTNGFQPLFAFLLVPIYALFGGDRYISLRGVLAVHWLTQIATALTLGLIVKTSLRSWGAERSTLGFWSAAFLWLASRYVLLNSYNALETGLTLLFYALVWRWYQLRWIAGWKRIGFGILLGLLVLARIDAAVFVAVLAAAELFDRKVLLPARMARAAAVSLIPFLISLPWWLYNLLVFGSLMPSSGSSQEAPFSFERVAPMLESLLQVAVPYIQVRWIEGVPQMLIHAAVILTLAAIYAKTTYPQVKNTSTFRMGVIIASSTFLLGFYYLFFSGAPHFYGRYLTPLMLVAIALAASALAQIDRFRSLPVIVLAPIALIAGISVLGWHFQIGVSQSPFYRDQLHLIETYVPQTDVVSAGQSGTIGYFRDRVVNLDGKVNAEALQNRDNMELYLERRHISWYCDWTSSFLGTDPAANGWTVVAKRGDFALYHRDSAQ